MRPVRKLPFCYCIAMAVVLLVTYIYNLFGHGVHSMNMDLMFVPVALMGVCYFALLGFYERRVLKLDLTQVRGYRLFFNLHNAGLATFCTGQFLLGIIQIAGAHSRYPRFFVITGAVLMAGAFIVLACGLPGALRKAKENVQ